MEILDQDMQMVRDFLKEANAPFHITSHFENLVSEHAKSQEEISELQEQVESLTDEESARYQKLEEEFDEYKREGQAEVDDAAHGALETVKYWLHDVLVLKRPMQTPPQAILRIVEDVL